MPYKQRKDNSEGYSKKREKPEFEQRLVDIARVNNNRGEKIEI